MKSIVVRHQNFIKIQYSKNYEKIRISTSVRVENKHQFSKGKLKCTFNDFINKQFIINQKHQDVETLITDYFIKNKCYPSVNELRYLINDTEIDTSSKSEAKRQSNLLLFHFQEFMMAKASDFSINGKRPESIKDYRNVMFYLEDYERYLKKQILLQDINKQWFNGFVRFLETPRKGRRYKSKRCLVGKTIKKRIVMLLSFFRWLDAEEIFPFPKNIRGYSKNVADSPTVKTTLSKDEVLKIYNTNPSIKQHEFVRDVFVFACYTGLRWSDLISLSKKNIKYLEGIGYVVDKQTIKTNDRVVVPLNSVAYSIITKWNFNFDYYSNACFNKALKGFLHSTGWFEAETDFANLNGGYKKIFEIISIHRGRDIFITSLLNSRVPIPEVMKYTGHKSMATLMGYVDVKTQVKNYTDELLNI